MPTSSLSRVLILAGGISHERDISLRSGRRVADSLAEHGIEVEQRDPDASLIDYLTENRMTATITEHIEIAELVVRDRLPAALDALRHHVGASQDVVMERAANALAMTRMMT